VKALVEQAEEQFTALGQARHACQDLQSRLQTKDAETAELTESVGKLETTIVSIRQQLAEREAGLAAAERHSKELEVALAKKKEDLEMLEVTLTATLQRYQEAVVTVEDLQLKLDQVSKRKTGLFK
jgi:chromosome segregation ATPase